MAPHVRNGGLLLGAAMIASGAIPTVFGSEVYTRELASSYSQQLGNIDSGAFLQLEQPRPDTPPEPV